MNFKQWMRRLFSDLWFKCADMGRMKIGQTSALSLKDAEWWESFIERCDKRAMHHAEFVPGKDHGQEAARE